jgi:hypothetical protein
VTIGSCLKLPKVQEVRRTFFRTSRGCRDIAVHLYKGNISILRSIFEYIKKIIYIWLYTSKCRGVKPHPTIPGHYRNDQYWWSTSESPINSGREGVHLTSLWAEHGRSVSTMSYHELWCFPRENCPNRPLQINF